jgi:hypothetical protein
MIPREASLSHRIKQLNYKVHQTRDHKDEKAAPPGMQRIPGPCRQAKRTDKFLTLIITAYQVPNQQLSTAKTFGDSLRPLS